MLAEKTGWDYETILWGVSWLNIKMMLADAPSMRRVKKAAGENKVKLIKGSDLIALMNEK